MIINKRSKHSFNWDLLRYFSKLRRLFTKIIYLMTSLQHPVFFTTLAHQRFQPALKMSTVTCDFFGEFKIKVEIKVRSLPQIPMILIIIITFLIMLLLKKKMPSQIDVALKAICGRIGQDRYGNFWAIMILGKPAYLIIRLLLFGFASDSIFVKLNQNYYKFRDGNVV